MKINYSGRKLVDFGELNIGDVFRYGHHVWMSIFSLSVCDMEDDFVNAVALDIGEVAYFRDDEEVELLEAELTIK